MDLSRESLSREIEKNHRYKQLSNASRFIAGDEEQFQSRRDYANSSSTYDEKFVDENRIFSTKYSNLSGEDLTNTFKYIFHKFKKGIYVRIKNNKMTTFLPFSKIKFTNEWGDRIKYNPSIFRKVSEELGYRFNDRHVNTFTEKWYANNCLVRYEYPICENDTDLENYHDLMLNLCLNNSIPDTEFFINRRDFPILKQNNTEPYNHIWDTEEQELVSHSYKKYVPIFSLSSIPSKFADILFPTAEDWARVRKSDGVGFTKYENVPSADQVFHDDFDAKLNTAVFRGSSTGIGVTIDTNQRLKVAYLSTNQTNIHQTKIQTKIQETRDEPLLDAGITKWKNRPRKLQGVKELMTIDIKSLPFGLIKPLTPVEQSRYKYIIHIKGYVSAYRLSYELNMGSVILMVDDPDGYQMWFSHLLKPYIHYVPVKSDLSDLFEKIMWCRTNNEKMKEILKSCKQFYDEYMTKNGIYKYITTLFHSLKKHTGTYIYTPFYEKQLENQRQSLVKKAHNIQRPVPQDGFLFYMSSNESNYSRFYNKYRAIQHTDVLNSLKFVKNLETTKNTVVDVFSVGNLEFVVKKQSIINNSGMTHEQFVGEFCINPLLKTIPNFLYTFGSKERGLVLEKIEGINFRTWLDTQFDYRSFINILSQVKLALIVAQRKCLFVHYDLFPWNVMIETLDKEIEIQYPVGVGKIIIVKTKLVPIIIDYGKSSCISSASGKSSCISSASGKTIIYSVVKPFEFREDHDMRTLIISSIKHLINNRNLRLDKYTIEKLVSLIRVYYPDVVNYTDMKRVCNEFSFSNSLNSLIKIDGVIKLDLISHFKVQEFITKKFNVGDVDNYFLGFYGEFVKEGIAPVKQIYRFSDEILSTYYSLFKKDGIPSTVSKILNEIIHTSFINLTDEMLHNKNECYKLILVDDNETVDETIDYYEMLEIIINTNLQDNTLKEKYGKFLACNKLLLMNCISVRNTIKIYI